MSQGLPSLQDVDLRAGATPPHRQLYRHRVRMSRGGGTTIDEPNLGLPAAVSGLQAMLTPTLATHPGGTVLNSIGTTTGPRIVIPLPAALATATAISSGTVVPTPITGAAGTAKSPEAPLPSMLIDTEWFYPQAYPKEIQQYLTTSFVFRYRPSDPAKIVEDTQEFLRAAYRTLHDVGLDIKISDGLRQLFDEITSSDAAGNPLHRYNESEATSSFYLILAYVVSTVLWTSGAGKQLRNYPAVTYPGVIMSCYVYRLTRYYNDVSKVMGLSSPIAVKPYLVSGGRTAATATARLLEHGEPTRDLTLGEAYQSIPPLTADLFIVAQYLTGRLTSTTNCSQETYAALQQAALNVPGLDDVVVAKNIGLDYPDKSNPLAQKIVDARCSYFLGLIQGKIRPDDESAAVPGGPPGIALTAILKFTASP